MAAFESVLFGAGQDTFQQLYEKYNASVEALKGGASNFILAGNGIGSDPTYKSFWSTPVEVGGGGGAPNFDINFGPADDPNLRLLYKKSEISNQVTIYGRWRRIDTTLANDNAPTILFTLPVGFRPNRFGMFVCSGPTLFKLMNVFIDNNGDVFILNRSGEDFPIGAQSDMCITFNIS